MAGVPYNYKCVKDLTTQAMFFSHAVRRSILARIETLIDEIADGESHAYDYICYRVTGYQPAAVHGGLLAGAALRQDLMRMLDQISASLKERAAQAGEPVYRLADVARMFDVSSKTIGRWRKLGLKSRKMVFDGRGLRTAFLERYIDGFLERYGPKVKRLAILRQVTPEDRRTVLSRARQLMLDEHRGFSETVKRLTGELGFQAETTRNILLQHMGMVTGDAKNYETEGRRRLAMIARFDEGQSVGKIAREFNTTRAAVYRAVYSVRATDALSENVACVFNPVFNLPNAEQIILGKQLDPEVRVLDSDPLSIPAGPQLAYNNRSNGYLLTREQEHDLFRRYNFLKCRMAALQEEIRDSRVRAGLVRRYERLRTAALRIRRILVRANMRLVVSVARRHVGRHCELANLISDGNLSLLKAIEKFDFSRGNKFSTYATWALMKNYAKSIPEENYTIDTFITGHDELLRTASGPSEEPGEKEREARLREMVRDMVRKLNDRERRIIMRRYGLEDGRRPATLDELGREFGLTKERIRQIEVKALRKLKLDVDEDIIRALLK